MKYVILRYIIVFISLLPTTVFAAGLSWNGAVHTPVELKPEPSSGLDAVYVVYTTDGLSAEYTPADASSTLTCSRFDSRGGGFAEPITARNEGGKLILDNIEPDAGYLIKDGERQVFYFWVTDWSSVPYNINAVNIGDNDCGTTQLHIEGSAPRMTYTSINGRTIEIDRDINISYSSLAFSDESKEFVPVEKNESRPSLGENVSLPAPLCETDFTVTGDRFLQTWGMAKSVSSERMRPVAVDGYSEAIQHMRENDNEQKVENEEIGGSAPVDVTFKAVVTDAAIFTEWQMARDAEFEFIDYRSNELSFDHTFTEAGDTYVRFVAANDDASCEYTGDTYKVSVGESDLKIPNAFSPGTTEGVNDIWKVSYKSIVRFECHIFNKWGVKMCEFDNPADGWDGKYNGKLVPAGVYYYVIKATGADGRNWDKAGDINIVGYK